MNNQTNIAVLAQHRPAPQKAGSPTIKQAALGDPAACFELGVAYSTGAQGVACDMIEAHMWFNLAAARGHEEAADCRADLADEMTAREIAEAQRRARQWLASTGRRAA